MSDKGEQGAQGPRGATGLTGLQGKRGIGLSTLLLVVVIPLFGYLYADSVTRADDLRAACARTNDGRVSELRQRQNLLNNAQDRVEASNSAAERKASEMALQRAEKRKAELVASVKDVAVEEGSVVVDCAIAYPKPWPL